MQMMTDNGIHEAERGIDCPDRNAIELVWLEEIVLSPYPVGRIGTDHTDVMAILVATEHGRSTIRLPPLRLKFVYDSKMGFKDLDQLRAALRPSESPSRPAELPFVLVVDDDPHMRASLDLILSRAYRVELAANGQDGVALVRDELSAVILDVKMSGIDGFTTYEQMRKLDADLPIIFHSAYQDIKDPYEIINVLHPFGYIVKGEDHSLLLRTVADAVAQRTRMLSYRTLQSKLSNVRTQMESLQKRLAEK